MKLRATLMTTFLIGAALSFTGGAAPQDPMQGRGGQGGPGGPVMMGPMQQGERPIVAQFDKDKDKRLNAAERREG